MRKNLIKAESNTPHHDALIFFALSLDEQLYDLTDDSFKAPALNTFSRTLELQNIAQANHTAGISKDALRPFIEELSASVGKDAALSSRQKKLATFYIGSITENLAEADRIARGASGLRIAIGNYFESIIVKIKKIILESPKEKKNLASLVASFIVQAETLGFPRRHTYYVTQNTLITKLKKRGFFEVEQLLEKFFLHFLGEPSDYDCLFIGSESFSKYPQLLARFNITITKEPPGWEGVSADQRKFLDSIRQDEYYLQLTTKKQLSPAQAQKISCSIINEFVGLVKFYAHQEGLQSSKLSLVRDKNSGKIFRLHEALDPMHCWVSHTSATEDEMLEMGAITHGTALKSNSANKIRRTLRLHQSALKSNSAENQLIDLWAGFEALVSRPGRESQRLEYFSECLLPALTLTYPQKILTSAYCDVTRNFPMCKDVISGIPGDASNFCKFTRLVLCPDHKKAQDEFASHLVKHPLLMNRIWHISEIFKNRTETQKTLKHHRQKVKWHLSRIYHTRNSIMHSASALPYLPTLVENLHFYLDTLIKCIQKVSAQTPEQKNIDGILQYLATWEKYRLHALTSDTVRSDAPLTDADVWDVVFGAHLALTPAFTYEPLIS
jgi:hypothetical protein